MLSYFLLIIGLVVLIIGGEFLVKGAVSIAKKFQISSLVIGMTVISFGTSAPELIVSIKAAFSGNPEIAIGNVVGSNIINISLVLGLTVLIFPIIVDRNSKIIDWPMMMLASILFFLFALFFSFDGTYTINRIEGFILFGILITFIYYIISKSRKENKKLAEEKPKNSNEKIGKATLFLIIGLVGLYFGAEWLLQGAVSIAEEFGMSKSMIGITIIAFGTSVPELVTSCVAAFKKETDISVGNLIGSNIFNIMAVIGITAIIKPIRVEDSVVNSDLIWMLAIAFVLLPLMVFGKKLSRWKGFILAVTYILYIFLLIQKQNIGT